jgi:hypothetical protein
MSTDNSDAIEILLTDEQISQVAPVVRAACMVREHVLFLAAAVPDIENSRPVWKFQIRRVSGLISRKILKLLRTADSPTATIEQTRTAPKHHFLTP